MAAAEERGELTIDAIKAPTGTEVVVRIPNTGEIPLANGEAVAEIEGGATVDLKRKLANQAGFGGWVLIKEIGESLVSRMIVRNDFPAGKVREGW